MRSSSLFGQKVYSLITDYAPALQRDRKTANETGSVNRLIHGGPFAHVLRKVKRIVLKTIRLMMWEVIYMGRDDEVMRLKPDGKECWESSWPDAHIKNTEHVLSRHTRNTSNGEARVK